jgi:RNA polymerase sigma-70 factor (ECF subfamily)
MTLEIEVVDTLPENGKTDTLLLQRLSRGDLSAFEQIYYRWSRPVYGFMLKTTRSAFDAEDITQEVFARLWKMHEDIDPQKNIQALIFVIARRIAVDMFRRKGKIAITPADDPDGELSSGSSPQEILEERETDLLLEIAIESMPEKQRKVFGLYYFNNLSPMEISAQTGLSYDNVRKHIYNGKRHLREIISLISIFLMGQM